MSFAKAQELLKLAMMATRSSGVTLDEIVEEFGCVHRSAQRMTVALEAAFPQTRADHRDDRRRRWRIEATCSPLQRQPRSQSAGGRGKRRPSVVSTLTWLRVQTQVKARVDWWLKKRQLMRT